MKHYSGLQAYPGFDGSWRIGSIGITDGIKGFDLGIECVYAPGIDTGSLQIFIGIIGRGKYVNQWSNAEPAIGKQAFFPKKRSPVKSIF